MWSTTRKHNDGKTLWNKLNSSPLHMHPAILMSRWVKI